MADLLVVFAAIAVVGTIAAVIYGLTIGGQSLSDRRAASMAHEDQARRFAEERAVWFLARYPRLDDEEIATLIRDELLNGHMATPAAIRWAHPETVGRVRRTIVRGILEMDAE